MAEKIATREAYGNALAEFGEKYDFVVLAPVENPVKFFHNDTHVVSKHDTAAKAW